MSLLEIFIYSLKSVGTVLIVAAAGALIVRLNVLKKEHLHFLSRVVYFLMLPCLLMTKTAISFNFDKICEFYILPIACICFVFTGFFAGKIVFSFIKVKSDFQNSAVCACSFGNSSFVPLPLAASIISFYPQFQADPEASSRAVFYISIYLAFYSPMLWGIGSRIISGKKKEFNLFTYLSPPVIGIIAGIIIGSNPFLKDLFCLKTALFYPLFESAEMIAAATIPCALLILGGNLSHKPEPGILSKSVISGIVFVKLLLLPSLATLFIAFLWKAGLIQHDPVLALILILEAAVPSATNLIIISSIHNRGVEQSMSLALFWNYILAIPSLTFFIIICLTLFR